MKQNINQRKSFSYLQESFVLYYGIADKRTPFPAKFTCILALLYLLSPIDLVPDFIPVAGWLDDLVIVPLLLHVAFTLLPGEVKDAGWLKAKQHMVRLRIIFTVLIIVAIGIMVAVFYLLHAAVQHF
jgi:uncharacterized membrane protein YkvA (DUF1232 family)